MKLRGERDVIRLRNPTEDKTAFRRMLTSADRPSRLSESHAVGERYEVFSCFNRHNPILLTVI